jgi:hypothetical protein
VENPAYQTYAKKMALKIQWIDLSRKKKKLGLDF